MRNLSDALGAKLYQHHSEELILKDILKDYYESPCPIVLVGHSLGGGTTAKVAERLDKIGIIVSYLVLLDARSSLNIPESTAIVDTFVPARPFGLKRNKGSLTVIQKSSHLNLPDRSEVLKLVSHRISQIR
jgi:thioesterase domain-containing protein